MKKNILLISHTDLDGYASQFILYTLLDSCLHNFEFKNLNYDDVDNYLLELDYSKYDKVYITDLNIKLHTAKHIDIETSNVILIDHHTYDEAFNEFSWCNINTKYSAALNAFKYIDESTTNIINDNIRIFAELVSVYDLWKIEDEYFNTMTFISDVVYNCPMYYNKREFLFKYFLHLIYNEILYKSVYDIEMDYIDFCYQTFYTDKQLPTKQLCILSELDEFAKDIKIVYHSSIEIGITSIPSSNFQYLSSKYLREVNPNCVLANFNFKNGSGSVRSVNNKAITISKLLGGGGHLNAGGFSHTFKNIDEIIAFFMTPNIDLNKVCIYKEKIMYKYKPVTRAELKVLISILIKERGDNADLNDIDVSEITDMRRMFDCAYFNGDISKWDVSNVIDMSGMFANSKFSRNISNWDVSNVVSMDNIFFNSPLEKKHPKWYMI